MASLTNKVSGLNCDMMPCSRPMNVAESYRGVVSENGGTSALPLEAAVASSAAGLASHRADGPRVVLTLALAWGLTLMLTIQIIQPKSL